MELSFYPWRYTRREIWPTLFQVDEVTSPLRTFSKKQENELMEPLKFSKYQNGVGLMAVADPVTGRLGAVRSQRYA